MTASGHTCKVKAHGQRQLELDLTYPLDKSRKRDHYQLDIYIFSPYQLNVTKSSYGVERFFRDLRSYTRHTIPLITLKQMIHGDCQASPLRRIRDMLSATQSAGAINEQGVLYELRVLANAYHAQVHDTRELIKVELNMQRQTGDAPEHIMGFLDDIGRFLENFRSMRREFLDPRVSDLMRESFSWADEAISLSTEKTFFKLHDYCKTPIVPEDVRAAILAKLSSEPEYRKASGYHTIVTPGNPVQNENFLYRAGSLKKWAESCMFMSKAPAKITSHLAQALMAAAAGAAMIVALIATFFATRFFPMNSVPWAILIIFTYIAKDRIKDILRSVFIKFVPRLVADHVEDLTDPATNGKVGTGRSRAKFCRSNDLPDTVVNLRNAGKRSFQRIIPQDNVIHFHKTVRINTEKLVKSHKRLESLTEIIRLKTDAWLANMDDPVNKLYTVDNGKITRVTTRRVYHLNLVVSLSDRTTNAAGTLFRYRLVLTRKGIVRVEHCEITSS